MNRGKYLGLCLLTAVASSHVSADPMEERQAQLVQEREAYLQGIEQRNSAATQGWHWYQDPTEEEASQEQPTETSEPAAAPPPGEMVEIDVKWLRDNLPKLLDDAMNNPGDMEKVKVYWLAQKMAVDMATKFQDETRRMYIMNPQMSEDNRRPVTQFQLTSHNEQVKAGKQAAVQKVFDKAGLWFFYASTCQYCIKEGPILKYLERMYHVNILAVSMDSQPLPGTEFEDVVVDAGGQMSQQLGVTKTPSMFLVSNDGQKIHKLSEGLVTLEDMLESILYIAQAAGFITEQELQESRDVRQYLMTDSPSGEQAVSDPEQPQVNAPSLVAIPKSELEAGPQALIAHLESRLNFPSHNSQLAPVAMSGGQQ